MYLVGLIRLRVVGSVNSSAQTYRYTQDPALASSLPALLFLADVFWTGLVVERQQPPAKGSQEEGTGE